VKKLLLLLFLPLYSSAQIVNIPDPIFKAALVANTSINTNLDSEIQVSEANVYSDTISIIGLGISDLTGIEAFTALTYLDCEFNSLTSLDVSSNISLTFLSCWVNSITNLNVSGLTLLKELYCGQNWLTNLDVSSNTSLTDLACFNNSLTSLDISSNVVLDFINCSENLITSMDVSKNTVLTIFMCEKSSLSSLDLRNGNNGNMLSATRNNIKLKCISVDDEVWANANWSSFKDSWASYSNDCALGIEDNTLNKPTITTSNNIITIFGLGTATIYNLQGQVIASSNLPTSIEVNGSGIYLVKVESEGKSITQKIYLGD